MAALYYRLHQGGEGCNFQVELVFPATLVAQFGAPARSIMEVKVPTADAVGGGPSTISATLRMYNKTSTRRPEAMWISMQPPALAAVQPQILMNKLGASCDGCDRGSWIDSMTVVHNGSQRVHAVSDLGVQIRRPAAGSASFVSLDSALVRIGADDLTPLPMPSTQPNTSAGFAFNLWNNAWGTNYVMWCLLQTIYCSLCMASGGV